jgi:acyl-CoA synthetase (AMP-forming)/AMP-acid ligase II
VFGPHPDGIPTPPLSLGHPMASVELRLKGGETADDGVLQMRTGAVSPGYHNLPDETAKRFRDGWYDSGDVMRRDADGFYYFVGRADDMFVCGGENIYPGEVEMMLERQPGVLQATVVPLADEIKGQRPVAFIVRREGSSVTEDEIKAFALDNGPANEHPRHVAFLDELPLAGTNKIDVRKLTERAKMAWG